MSVCKENQLLVWDFNQGDLKVIIGRGRGGMGRWCSLYIGVECMLGWCDC